MPPIELINELIKWICMVTIFEMIFAYIDCFLFINLFKVKATNGTKLKIVLIDGILRTIFMVFVPAPNYRAFNLVCTIILFKIFFKQPIERCILGEVINAITIISVEAIFAKLFCILMPNIKSYKTRCL